MATKSSLGLNGTPTSPSESAQSSSPQEVRRRLLQNAIQPRLATKYLWDFYHDKGSTTAHYAERLTLYNEEPIDNWRTLMQYYNNFPFEKLRMKDAAHFFKHTVKPMREDARNQDGGAWYIKLSEDDQGNGENLALECFQQVLLMAVNGHFDEIIQPRDDLCGVSMSKRWKGATIMIWTRREEETTIQGIKEMVISQVSDPMKLWLEDGRSCYYKKHREHADFDDELAKSLMAEYDAKKHQS